jgi:uncharacterized protein YjbI with pentapeptide repeats
MAEWTKAQVKERVAKRQSLERADLRDLDLSGLDLSGVSFRRAELRGANLEKAVLRRANFSSADMREAFLAGADLREAIFQNADVEGAKFDGAGLQQADLTRASASGASFERADLSGARLTFAELDAANFGGASLKGAMLTSANLTEAYLGAAKLGGANLRDARMSRANLEKADLTQCDLRNADLSQAMLDGCTLNGARIGGIQAAPSQFARVLADWVDVAADGLDPHKTKGADVAAWVEGAARGRAFGAVPTDSDGKRRYFGEGDFLGGAQLEFSEGSLVEVQSRFKDCAITLRPGAKLIVGENGVFEGCRIVGAGDILVQGRLAESGDAPSIVGPRRLVVAAQGSLVATVQQPSERTRFGFEPGCHLRLKITR